MRTSLLSEAFSKLPVNWRSFALGTGWFGWAVSREDKTRAQKRMIECFMI
jgi:hypothetical protein